MNGALSLRRATGDDWAFVTRLLDGNGLPTADLGGDDVVIWVVVEDSERVGCGGLELYENVGLLRSVVVDGPQRGRGLGSDLCDALEAEARAAGVTALYLLTTTAAGFFDARGYERCDRADAPESIRTTAEFASLCPVDATCMRTTL